MPLLSDEAAPLDCTITSPPYWYLKDYGHGDQIGYGQTLDHYLSEMASVFRKLHDHTRSSGSLWVVVDALRLPENGRPTRQYPLPFELVGVAEKVGWTLRETVVWKKDRTLPWSSGRRLRNLFEYVLFFVKDDSHKFYADRLRDYDLGEWWVKWPERYNPNGRQPSNVWEVPIPVQGSWRSPEVRHVCPLPEELVRRMVLLSTDPNDLVFDPFAGTGVVLSVASSLGRRSAGLDIDPSYSRRYQPPARDVVTPVRAVREWASMRKLLIQLRALKFPKVLFQRYIRLDQWPAPHAILVRVGRIGPETLKDGREKPVKVTISFVFTGDAVVPLNEITTALCELSAKPPLSKFGIEAEVSAVTLDDVGSQLPAGRRQFVYEAGHTWAASRSVKSVSEIAGLETPTARRNQYSYPPIVANLRVKVSPDVAAS